MTMETLNAETLYAMLVRKDALAIGELPNMLGAAPSRAIAHVTVELTKLIQQHGEQENSELMLGMLEEMYNHACSRERQFKVDADLVELLFGKPERAQQYRPQTTDRHRGDYKGENRTHKPVITELQKGQSNFSVNGHPIPAGSYKAAVKKYQKMVKQSLLPASLEPEPHVTTQAH